MPLASCQCGYAITQHGLKLHYSITHSSSGNTGLTFREPPEDPYPRQNSILHTACPALSSKTSITKMRRLGVSKKSIAQTFVNKKCRGKSFGILILPGCVDKSMPNPSVGKNTAITTTYSGYGYLVEHTGFEPVTSTLPVWRAPNCANTPYSLIILKSLLCSHIPSATSLFASAAHARHTTHQTRAPLHNFCNNVRYIISHLICLVNTAAEKLDTHASQKIKSQQRNLYCDLARLAGLEPAAYCLEGSCSIQLS